MDPVLAAKQSEQEARLPFIAPEEFWTEHVPQGDGSFKQVEWVRWVKKGMSTPAKYVEKISRLAKNPGNPDWQVLKPYYDSWKAGQAAPVNGIPLEAWPGATPSLVKALASVNIRSIEDLAEMEDSSVQRIAIPGMREKKNQARAFLEAQKTTAGVAGELNKLRESLSARDNEIAELRALIEQHAIAVKRKPGRPKKAAENQPEA
jgi:hypothetical protein